MTPSGRAADQPPQSSAQPTPDPERVLSQALRAMAGGGRQGRNDAQPSAVARQHTGPKPGLSLLQIVLIATIFGLLVGITIGLVTLLT